MYLNGYLGNIILFKFPVYKLFRNELIRFDIKKCEVR